MLRTIDDPSGIDSTCDAPPLSANGPTDEKCNTEATTYVFLPSGIRRYICADHADEVDRHDDLDLDDHPTVVECEACRRLTPKERVDFDGRCDECRVEPA